MSDDIELLQKEALAAIDHINYCAERLAKLMGMATHYEAAKTALDNIVCRIDDLPMDIENIRDDATGEGE